MKVAIVKYNAGNVRSVTNALQRLGVDSEVTDDLEALQTADKVIFPGVGEASSAMNYLRERNLTRAIRSFKQPVLAICLGMQLLCRFSEENNTECLGIFRQTVKRFPAGPLRVPQIGWNNISGLETPVFEGITEGVFVYFANSYFVESDSNTIAAASYGLRLSAAIHYKNFYGLQFHPEKSGPVGAKILENFLKIA
ncbi:MAG: imidazole glycerol phosphate synthase subunit HisH [Acidobacteriota bacterium]